eukprot:5869958-Lingulodinium_polyedra.AAC.1
MLQPNLSRAKRPCGNAQMIPENWLRIAACCTQEAPLMNETGPSFQRSPPWRYQHHRDEAFGTTV